MRYNIMNIKTISPLALIIIFISILLHGQFSWNTWLSSPPEEYPLEFNSAKWIGIKGNLPQGYYRKEVYINEQVKNGWLKIAASDSYQLYVNGKLAGQKIFTSTEVAGIYDITSNLLIGKNVIAVCVRRFNIKQVNKVIVEFGYEDRGGIKRIIPTDNTWKVTPVEEWQAHGEILWNEAEFNDFAWESVSLISSEDNKRYFVNIDPVLFEKPPEGYWIWGTDSSLSSVVLQYSPLISGRIKKAWLRVAIDGKYQLYINDQRVGSSEISAGYLDIYNIAQFIKRGKNVITIVASKEPSSPGVLIDGFVIDRENVHRFTENNWGVTSLNNKVFRPVTPSALYNLQSDGVLIKRFVDPLLSGTFRFQTLITQLLWLFSVGVLWISVWIGCSFLIHRIYGITLSKALLVDSVTHLPSILLLSFLYLLKYDINHNISFPYQERFIIGSILLIFLFKIVFMLDRYLNIRVHPLPHPYLKNIPVAILLALVIIGGFIRIKGLDHQSLYHDEIHMIKFTQGIFEKGYPYKMIGPIERPLATYEVLPYPIALSMLLFGSNDFAYRLPAAIFGILTILLIYYVSASLINRWAAIVATAIYTFFPPAILWAQYLWHPQQAQFFALLTSFLFYKAIEKEVINKRYLYLATATYIMLYLTWEGTGFFLGSLFIGLLVVKGRDFRWIRDKHLWIGVGIISGVVIIQLVRRFLLQIPYLVVGTGNSEITSPSLFFLNPMYDPSFYIKMFLWREYNFILTLLCILGIPFLTKYRLLRYYYTMVFATLFLMTNLFSANAIRYVVFLEPFLIISAVAVIAYIVKHLLQSLGEGHSGAVKSTVYVSLLFMQVVLWMSTNEYIYKFYKIADSRLSYGNHWRSGDYYIDYRSPVRFVANNYQKGDLIISVVPYTTEFYGGIETDYFLQSITARQVLYDITEENPMYLERTIGKPVLRGVSEFNDIASRYQKMWVFAIPYTSFQKLTDKNIQEYLAKNGRVVYESYNARIYLIGGVI